MKKLMIAATLILGAAGIYAGLRYRAQVYLPRKSLQQDYEKLTQEVSKIRPESFQTDSAQDTEASPLEKARQLNGDVVGWIYIPDTNIDFPVVQGEDNDKYLHTLFDGTYGFFGTLFVDSITEAPFIQFNTIVYGHHMKDGSMLASISKLTDPSWCDEHPQLELITPDNKYHLEIWAFLNQPADSSVYTTNFHDADMQADYLRSVQSLAAYTTDVSVSPDDMIVLLSTCVAAEGEARYIAVCKMVPWE